MRRTQLLLAFSWLLSLNVVAGCGDDTNGNDGSGGSGGSGDSASSASSASGTGGTGGTGDSSSSAGGAGGEGGQGGAGGLAESVVSGTALDTYDSGITKETVPVSPTKWTSIEALVEQDGKLSTYPGTLAASGTLQIPDVPEGPYWLALTNQAPADLPASATSKTFIKTDSRSLDLGTLYSYRKDVEAITQPTFVVLNAALTVPWQAYEEDGQGNVLQELDDSLTFVSRSADVNGGIYAVPDGDTQINAPTNGAAGLSGWKFDAKADFLGFGDSLPHLVRADKKDDFAILHSVASKVSSQVPSPLPDPWDGYTYTVAKEIFRPDAFTMTNGGTVTLDGVFEPVSGKTFSLDYKGSLFNQLLDDVPHTLTDASLNFTVYVEHGAPNPAIGGWAPLADFFVDSKSTWVDPVCNPDACDPVACPAGCSDATKLVLPGDYAHDFAYGNPFEAGQEVAGITFAFWSNVKALLPNDMSSQRLQGRFNFAVPAAELSGAPLQPVVSLPRNVKVNGAIPPADQITMGVGTTPEITFEPPTLGSPTSYLVWLTDVDDLKDANGNVLRTSRVIASFLLPSATTSVKVPDGLLQAGKHYYVQVTARVEEGEDLAAPFRLTQKSATAMTFTGIIMP